MFDSEATANLELRTIRDKRSLLAIVVEVVGVTLTRLAVVALAAYAVHEARLAMSDLAGKATTTDFGFRFLSNINFGQALAWLSCFCGLGYGELQRRAKHRVIRTKGKQIKDLESIIDPTRESSED